MLWGGGAIIRGGLWIRTLRLRVEVGFGGANAEDPVQIDTEAYFLPIMGAIVGELPVISSERLMILFFHSTERKTQPATKMRS